MSILQDVIKVMKTAEGMKIAAVGIVYLIMYSTTIVLVVVEVTQDVKETKIVVVDIANKFST